MPADVIDYRLIGDALQGVVITLDPGEGVIAEAGGMLYMDDGIQMATTLDPNNQGGGLFGKLLGAGKRILTGESFFIMEHGILPVPAPASSEILRGVPVYSTDTNFELTTPTGAALVKELSSEFGTLPLMNIEQTGFGAGNMDFKDRPNVLRLFVGEMYEDEVCPSPIPLPQEEGVRGRMKISMGQIITVIEANIDDMNPQIYEYVMENLFKKGALDVFLTQIIMKKGRPGIKLTVLCKESAREKLIKIIHG